MTSTFDAAALLSIANFAVCATTVGICTCRIRTMTRDNTRRIVRVAYCAVFAGAFVGAALFGGAMVYAALTGGGLFGLAFRATWVQALGWWCLVVNLGPLGLLLSTANIWQLGVPPHAMRGPPRQAPRPQPRQPEHA